MSICTAVLVRDHDGVQVAWEGYAGGDTTARDAFGSWAKRWSDLGLSFESDPETLTLKRRWCPGHTVVAKWHEVSAA